MAPGNLFRLRNWLLIAPAFLFSFALCLWGFAICQTASCKLQSPLEALVKTILLLRGTAPYVLGKDPPQLVIGQILLPLSALMGGVTLLLDNIRHDVRVALAGRARNHVIVCGLGETGRQVVESFLDAKWGVVAITRDAETFEAQACEKRGVAVLEGDASQPAMLKMAGLARARALVVATGSDASNVEIGLRAREVMEQRRARRERLQIIPELRTDWLYSAIVRHMGATLESRVTEIRPIHLNGVAARALLHANAFQLASPPIPRRPPHLLVIGFGMMSSEVVSHAILCQFAVPGLRASITILDPDADAARAALAAKHPHLAEVADVTVRDCDFAVDDASYWPMVEEAVQAAEPVAMVVGIADDDASLSTALALRMRLDLSGRLHTPIYVRLSHKRELGAFLAGLETEKVLQDRFIPFGYLAPLTSPTALLDPVRDVLARMTHQTHREHALVSAHADAEWHNLPEPVKRSNRAFADHIAVKLRSLGLRLAAGGQAGYRLSDAQLETLAAMEHWRWSVERRAEGWRYGPERDEYQRLHPDLVDWSALSPGSRTANLDLVRHIPQIAEAAGYAIVEDALIWGFGDDATARLAALDASKQPIVVTDPQDPQSLAFARNAVQQRRAKLWLIRRSGPWSPRTPTIAGLLDDIAPAVEAWVREDDLAAVRQADDCP
ncbi:MAG: NAD-binding protein [Caulobacterales bacterium]